MRNAFSFVLVTFFASNIVHANMSLPNPKFAEIAKDVVSKSIADLVTLQDLAESSSEYARMVKAALEKKIETRIKALDADVMRAFRNEIDSAEQYLTVWVYSVKDKADKKALQKKIDACKSLREKYIPAAINSSRKSTGVSTILAGAALALAFSSAGFMISQKLNVRRSRA